MPFVSHLIGRTVVDYDGETVGRVKDLLATHRGGMPHPQIAALLVRQPNNQSVLVSVADVIALMAPVIPLRKKKGDIVPIHPGENDLFLVHDVLDKQIIDVNGVRVVRVNDLELTRVNEEVYVANVDISSRGLLRRLGVPHLPEWLSSRKKPKGGSGFISWESVEVLSSDQPVRLKVPGERIAELHPADLAEILSDLTRAEGSKFLESLDVKTMADTLEEVEPEFQASLVEEMPNERVADVLEEMAPDEAADLLAELPEDRSQELLELMEDDEAEDVRKLLAYPEESAGGIMNTDYVTVPPELTVTQTIEILRETQPDIEAIYYLYVVDSQHRLIGVLSLRELVLAKPDALVAEIMQERVLTVNLLDSQDEVAQVISKYNLLAVPVVDSERHMQGIVTADDALDKIIPTAWKKRLPRFYH